MFRTLLAIILVGATLSSAIPVDEDTREVSTSGSAPRYICGNNPTNEEVSAAEAHFSKNKLESEGKVAISTINVYVNVITSGSQGNIPDNSLVAQVNVLNANFAGTNVRFALAGVRRTNNPRWFDYAGPNTADQTQMKNNLRFGTVRDLNVYTVGFTRIAEQNLLGYATFPWSFQSAPQDDGVVIRFGTTPGGGVSGYNSGKNLVHEVGHWVGLYHPFQGGCNGGDYVDDTPAEATPGFGCDRNRDTCPAPGLDPIDNFMDYSDEVCKTRFTAGQVARLNEAVRIYRGIN